MFVVWFYPAQIIHNRKYFFFYQIDKRKFKLIHWKQCLIHLLLKEKKLVNEQ
jgi:hypothetical protein